MSGEFNRIKFEERILNEANRWLRSSVSDPRLNLVTVTKVSLNRDYSVATIYWDSFAMENREDSEKAIKGCSKKLRHHLSQNLNVRHTPAVSFVYDSQYEDEQNIMNLLKQSESEKL